MPSISKEIDPVDFNSNIRTLCFEICRNTELVSFFTRICLYRTCSLDRSAVSSCLDVLDDLFDVSSLDGRLDTQLPSNFCFDVFFVAIRQLLQSEDFQVLCKTLGFLYTNLGRFYGDHREQLLLIILIKETFFKLFPHWSYLVRKFYHHILVYKIRRRGFLYDMSFAISSIPPINAEKEVTSPSSIISMASSLLFSPLSSLSSLLTSGIYRKTTNPEQISVPDSKNPSTLTGQLNNLNYSNFSRFESDSERLHRESLESIDAEHCSVISSRLTLLEVQEDEIIESTLLRYIRCVEDDVSIHISSKLENSFNSVSIPRYLHPYCDRALHEFKILRQQAIMLQRKYSSTLSCFDVVAPDLFFDVVEFAD